MKKLIWEMRKSRELIKVGSTPSEQEVNQGCCWHREETHVESFRGADQEEYSVGVRSLLEKLSLPQTGRQRGNSMTGVLASAPGETHGRDSEQGYQSSCVRSEVSVHLPGAGGGFTEYGWE